jgi:hypothetical protein
MAERTTRSSGRRGPDPRVRELYAVPPAEFVAARDALARALAAEGSSDAATVKRLRRPTLAVWLLDALARERPELISAAFAAGDLLRQAQVRAVRGDAAELRGSSAAVRDAVAAGLEAAREIAARKGAGTAVLGQVERGLRAVVTTDTAARAPLQDGVLDRLPELGGTEFLTGLAAVPPVSPARHATGTPRSGREPARPLPESRDRVERSRKGAERSARAEAARRERERRQAERRAERSERALHAVEARVQRAERELEEAQRRVDAVRTEADTARQAARTARAKAEAAHRSAPV